MNLLLATTTIFVAILSSHAYAEPQYNNCLSESRFPLGPACNRLPALDKTKLRTYKTGMTRYTFQYSYSTEQNMTLIVSNSCGWNPTQTQTPYKSVQTYTRVWNWSADQGPIQYLWNQVDDFLEPLKLNACAAADQN